jgi:hypothetical protein
MVGRAWEDQNMRRAGRLGCLVAEISVRDLLDQANFLFVAANRAGELQGGDEWDALTRGKHIHR